MGRERGRGRECAEDDRALVRALPLTERKLEERGRTQSPPCAANRSYPSTSTMSESHSRAMLTRSLGETMGGEPKRGIVGITTSNETFFLDPSENRAGEDCKSGRTTGRYSLNEP